MCSRERARTWSRPFPLLLGFPLPRLPLTAPASFCSFGLCSVAPRPPIDVTRHRRRIATRGATTRRSAPISSVRFPVRLFAIWILERGGFCRETREKVVSIFKSTWTGALRIVSIRRRGIDEDSLYLLSSIRILSFRLCLIFYSTDIKFGKYKSNIENFFSIW